MIKILHVDGDIDYLRRAREELGRLGPDFVIDIAENSAEAFAKHAQTTYDIILTDYRLPFSNGIDLIRTIRDIDREIPIFLLSFESGEEILLEALRVGANDYFSKSTLTQFDELFAAISSAVGIRNQRLRKQSLILARQAIAEGTSLSTGRDFFDSLLKFVALSLDVNFSFIGGLSADSKIINTISVWGFGHQIDNFSFPITGTVSEAVVGRKTCVFPDNVLMRFPKDKTLQEMGVKSFIGCPLFDHSGNPLGIIAAMDNKPLEQYESASSFLTAMSTRASVELERYIAGYKVVNRSEFPDSGNRGKKTAKTLLSPYYQKSVTGIFDQSLLDRMRSVLTESKSRTIKHLLESAAKIASTDLSVLITGNKGTCKSLLATYIHQHSNRAAHHFFHVDCSESASINLEMDLFGAAESTPKGIAPPNKGILEHANGGTVFFNNIHSLDIVLQARLIDFIKRFDIKFRRGKQTRGTDIRIIAATDKSLTELVGREEFNEELFQELKNIMLEMPSLQDRLEDISSLASFFLGIIRQKHPDVPMTVSEDVLAAFNEYDWPGNVRQFESVINFAATTCSGETVELKDIPHQVLTKRIESREDIMMIPLKELERRAILKTIEHFGGNKSKAARNLGISERKLFYKLKEYEKEST